MFIDPDMGRRPRMEGPDFYTIALMFAIAFILCLLVACQMPLR